MWLAESPKAIMINLRKKIVSLSKVSDFFSPNRLPASRVFQIHLSLFSKAEPPTSHLIEVKYEGNQCSLLVIACAIRCVVWRSVLKLNYLKFVIILSHLLSSIRRWASSTFGLFHQCQQNCNANQRIAGKTFPWSACNGSWCCCCFNRWRFSKGKKFSSQLHVAIHVRQCNQCYGCERLFNY